MEARLLSVVTGYHHPTRFYYLLPPVSLDIWPMWLAVSLDDDSALSMSGSGCTLLKSKILPLPSDVIRATFGADSRRKQER
ncbi:hypothetical protein F2Q68_00016553 [Brassica cretica]|uniref:Uncharacterized protein n=1 Tax=Brassica cretica TaxID=69181 RepID=A0A8S9HHX9_BRACR|nr:hypothetical protein F2Q68_00016553 [Brassica cretica]